MGNRLRHPENESPTPLLTQWEKEIYAAGKIERESTRRQEILRDASALIATHTIEPELKSLCPRYVHKRFTTWVFTIVSLILLTPSGIVIAFLFSDEPKPMFLLLLITGIIALCGGIWLSREQIRIYRERYELVRQGEAVPALITEVESTGEDYRIIFTRSLPNGSLTTHHYDVAGYRWGHVKRNVGDTVTLLVSPQNPARFLPYVLASDFRVIAVEGTKVSQIVSANIAAKTRSATQTASHLRAIEPELMNSTPRRVRFSPETTKLLNAMAAAVALYATGISIFWTAIWNQSSYAIGAIMIGYLIILPYVQTAFASSFKIFRLLQNGTATKGVIVLEQVASETALYERGDQVVAFLYEFETDCGLKRASTFSMRYDEAYQLGLKEGAAFTVLYDSNKPTHNQPYFRITGAEVIGATRAKITPP